MKAVTTIITGIIVLLATCTMPPPTAPDVTGASTLRQLAESSLPDLCDLEGGRWCKACEGEACPVGEAGSLCCSGGVCVVWSAGSCAGTLGWCPNYTTETDPSGIEVATCHDDEAT